MEPYHLNSFGCFLAIHLLCDQNGGSWKKNIEVEWGWPSVFLYWGNRDLRHDRYYGGIAVGPRRIGWRISFTHQRPYTSTCLTHFHCLLTLIKSVGSLASVDSVVPMGHLTEKWLFLMRSPFSTHFVCQKIRNVGLDWKALICTASIIWLLTTFPLFPGNTFIPFISRSHIDSLLRILLEPTMSRPKTAGERNESIMVEKAKKAMERTKDPVEKLRFVLTDVFWQTNSQTCTGASAWVGEAQESLVLVECSAGIVVHLLMAYFVWYSQSLSSGIYWAWMSSRIDDDGSKSICYEEFKKGIHDTGLDLEEQGYQVDSCPLVKPRWI